MQELVDKLVLAEADPLRDEFLKLSCVFYQGKFQSTDVRRLACLQEYARKVQREVRVKVNVTDCWDDSRNISKFVQHYTTRDGGTPTVRWRNPGDQDQRPHHDRDRDWHRDDRERRQPIGQGRGKDRGGKGQGKKGKRKGYREDGSKGSKGRSRKGRSSGKGDARHGHDDGGQYPVDDDYRDNDQDSRQGIDEDPVGAGIDADFFDEEDFVSAPGQDEAGTEAVFDPEAPPDN